jgi:hypothetical protein
MRQFTYAVKLTSDKENGGYVVTCRDLPEAVTQGETIEEAITEAADCLESRCISCGARSWTFIETALMEPNS